MQKTNKTPTVLSNNYRELIFVFAAFTLMVLAAYISVGRIVKGHLLDRAQDIINTAETNVRAGVLEAEATLISSYHMVQGMVEQNASQEELLDYLTATTEWMRQEHGLMNYYGIYGYINGEFIDGLGMNPGYDYVPENRPWYHTSILSGNDVAYTFPYIDWHTGDNVISVVRNINKKNGEVAGVLAMDIGINWLVEYVSSLAPTSGGYGMLISQNMTIMAHQDRSNMGLQLQNLDSVHQEIAHILRSGEDMFARKIKNSSSDSSVIVFFSRIFNGWYVGVVIPYLQFYRDIYITGIILTVLGIIFSIALCYILLRLSAAKIQSDEESRAKSSFLAAMSHEIRTPMNAIIGMAEITLREDLPPKAYEHIFTIKQAGTNLLSIINNILDFSKIESGKFEIVEGDYLFSSLINDVISIIRMKAIDSNLHFVVNIDCNIPNALYGDEIRIRQILVNILSNAVKYTDSGYVSLTVYCEAAGTENITELTMTVTDSGKGIKPEDIGKLFGNFVQVNTGNNRGIEGTGLGLAITRSLAEAMGGNITVASEYGKGSTFTVTLPQKIRGSDKIASVENVGEKHVLVYELLDIYVNSIVSTVDNLGAECTLVSSNSEFREELETGKYNFAFVAADLYENVKDICEKHKKAVKIALLAEFGEAVAGKNLSVLSMPVYSVSIANILNGESEVFAFNESNETVIGFTAPQANVLVVDDVNTNLMVAEGLLMPYKMQVKLCGSGKEAIEAVSANKFDLVLMDHMMPEMDGIEATKRIRDLRMQIPIVALTANAVTGMKEMFLENGFNDYLSKPIDLMKLNAILEKWIPKEKQEKASAENGAPPATVQPGLNPKLLEVFRRDAEKAVETLRKTLANGDIKLFTTTAHAMKSALANIGENEISASAFALEKAGQAVDIEFISTYTGAFIETLEALIKKLSPAETAANDDSGFTEDVSFLTNQLQIMKTACDDYDDTAAYSALDKLKERKWKAETNTSLEDIRDTLFLHSDFEEAGKKIELLLLSEKKQETTI